MFDSGPLGFFHRFSLCFCHSRHECHQGVSYGLFHGCFRGTVECQAVDHSSDDHTSPEKSSDIISHVAVIAAELIDPADDQYIAGAQHIEEAPAVWSQRIRMYVTFPGVCPHAYRPMA